MDTTSTQAPLSIRILAIVTLLFGVMALVGSLLLWGQGFLFSFPEGVNYALPLADVLVNAPASILVGVGLWQLRPWGPVAAYLVAGSDMPY